MKAANWIILAALLGMLLATIWIGYDMWTPKIDDAIAEGAYVRIPG